METTYLYLIQNIATKAMMAMRTPNILKINQTILCGDGSTPWRVIGEITETVL